MDVPEPEQIVQRSSHNLFSIFIYFILENCVQHRHENHVSLSVLVQLSELGTWPIRGQYPDHVINLDRSDLDTGFWLVEGNHVIDGVITWPGHWPLIGLNRTGTNGRSGQHQDNCDLRVTWETSMLPLHWHCWLNFLMVTDTGHVDWLFVLNAIYKHILMRCRKSSCFQFCM